MQRIKVRLRLADTDGTGIELPDPEDLECDVMTIRDAEGRSRYLVDETLGVSVLKPEMPEQEKDPDEQPD